MRAELREGEGFDQLLVTVEDNGLGLQADAAGGIGLPSMRERALELGGAFEVARPAGGGTRIEVRLPITIDDAAGGDLASTSGEVREGTA